MWRCASCETMNEDTAEVCIICGTSRAEAEMKSKTVDLHISLEPEAPAASPMDGPLLSMAGSLDEGRPEDKTKPVLSEGAAAKTGGAESRMTEAACFSGEDSFRPRRSKAWIGWLIVLGIISTIGFLSYLVQE